MKFAEINKQFTDIVEAYLQDGYVFNTSSFGRCITMGDICKVDLTDGKEIVRIRLTESRDKLETARGNYYLTSLTITVGVETPSVKPNTAKSDPLFPTKAMDIVYLNRVFAIPDSGSDGDWYGSMSEAFDAIDIRRKRRSASAVPERINFGDDAKRIVLPYVRRQKGCASARASEIYSVSKKFCEDVHGRQYGFYTVMVRNRAYHLK